MTEELPEVPANFNPFEQPANAHDNTVIDLTPDQKAVSIDLARELIGAASFFHDHVKNNDLKTSIRYCSLSLIKGILRKLQETVGGTEDVNQDEQRRIMALRHANNEIHRLKREMGEGISTEAIAQKIASTWRIVYDWWQELGFSYCKGKIEPWFHGAGVEVDFTISLDRHVSTMSENPVSEKAEKDKKISDLAKELDVIEERNYGHEVLDTTKNRQWILNKIQQRFPSVQCREWQTHTLDNKHFLRSLIVSFDIKDVGETTKA